MARYGAAGKPSNGIAALIGQQAANPLSRAPGTAPGWLSSLAEALSGMPQAPEPAGLSAYHGPRPGAAILPPTPTYSAASVARARSKTLIQTRLPDAVLPATGDKLRRELHVFPSIRHVTHLLEASPTHQAGDSSRAEGRMDFFGTSSYPEALVLANDGWADGAKRGARMADRLADKIPDTLNRRPGWDVAPGQYFDVSRILEGEPECWASPMPRRGTPIRLLVNTAALHATSVDAMMNRGAAVMALVTQLQSRGESVEIWSGAGCRGDHRVVETIICISEAGAPMSTDSLAYWLGHPSAHRRHQFAIREHLMPEETHTASYGTSCDYELAKTPAVEPWDLVVNHSGVDDRWASEANALAWVIGELGKLTTHDAA